MDKERKSDSSANSFVYTKYEEKKLEFERVLVHGFVITVRAEKKMSLNFQIKIIQQGQVLTLPHSKHILAFCQGKCFNCCKDVDYEIEPRNIKIATSTE